MVDYDLILRLHERFGSVIETFFLYLIAEDVKDNYKVKQYWHDDPRMLSQVQFRSKLILWSHIYSMFDDQANAVDFRKLSVKLDFSDAKLSAINNLIIDLFNFLGRDLKIVRHNIGFHHSNQEKSILKGYESYHSLDLDMAYVFIECFGLIFRHIDKEFPDLRLNKFNNNPENIYTDLKWTDLHHLIKSKMMQNLSADTELYKIFSSVDAVLYPLLLNEGIIGRVNKYNRSSRS